MIYDGTTVSKLYYNVVMSTLGLIIETNKFGIEYPFSGDELRNVCYNKNMTNKMTSVAIVVTEAGSIFTIRDAILIRDTIVGVVGTDNAPYRYDVREGDNVKFIEK